MAIGTGENYQEQGLPLFQCQHCGEWIPMQLWMPGPLCPLCYLTAPDGAVAADYAPQRNAFACASCSEITAVDRWRPGPQGPRCPTCFVKEAPGAATPGAQEGTSRHVSR